MLIHLDGDVLVYRAGFAAEHVYHTVECAIGGEMMRARFADKERALAFLDEQGINYQGVAWSTDVEVQPEANALMIARSIINKILEDMSVGEDALRVYLSGAGNFRNGVATIKEYKANRANKRKPVHSAAIKGMLRREYNVILSDGQEADDDIGIAHYACWVRDPQSTVIATIDKDLDMIPGLHYNFVTGETRNIEPEEGMRWFWTQMLTGDTTDNIPGIPGVGKVKAAKILADLTGDAALYGAVAEAYKSGYGETWESALLENGRLLWIRREPDEWWSPIIYNQGDST